MEQENTQETVAPAVKQTCPICLTAQIEGNKFCATCGYPELGTDQEKDAFDLKYKMLRASYEGSLQEAGKGTNTLYWLSGLIFVGDLIFYGIKSEPAYLVAAFLIPAIFIPLALWAKKKPFEALLVALIIYATIIVADFAVNPASILSGIFVKIVIIGFIIRGIKAGYESKKLLSELQQRHWTQHL